MNNFICHKCESDFKYLSILKRHLNMSSRCKTSKDEITNIINTINTNIINNRNTLIKCNDCNTIFTKNSSLKFHQKNSKCGKIQIAKSILTKDGVSKLSMNQIKLLYPDTFSSIIKKIEDSIINN